MNIKLRFSDLREELLIPVKELQEQLDFCLVSEERQGIHVVTNEAQEGLQVIYQEQQATIVYQHKAQFFRGLGLLVEAIREHKELNLTEKPVFNSLTYMQDNSRNAVSNITSVKKMLRQLALMGYTSFMLYTEDTYEIEGYPFFGYQRGRFSKEELKQIVEYGSSFGIELIPCIQTLAHLNAIFKWNDFQEVRDLGDILLCGEDKTYELIEAMIRTCSEVFGSNKINIGMDEAEMLGLGKYLKQYGYTKPSDIMAEHLNKVLTICEKYGFQALMWSDMFFKMLGNNSSYYSLTDDITEEIKDKIPNNVTLIYWDYYTRKKETYDSMIIRHKQLTDRLCFAGGAWKWQGFAPLLQHSLFVSSLALQSCVEHGIRDVIVTGWGDNGAETANFSVGPVLQQYAELCYHGSDREDHLKKRLATCTNMIFEDFMELDSLNFTPDNPSPGRISVGPAKYIFYQDVLQGLFDKHIDENTYPEHFNKCYKKLSAIAAKKNEYSYMFNSLAKLAYVLELKCDMGIRLKKAYDSRNLEELRGIATEECTELVRRIELFHAAFKEQWYLENKPFGFDVQDLRIGGLKERIRSVSWAVERFLKQEVDKIDELEQERLVLDPSENPGYATLPLYHNEWNNMVTASVL